MAELVKAFISAHVPSKDAKNIEEAFLTKVRFGSLHLMWVSENPYVQLSIKPYNWILHAGHPFTIPRTSPPVHVGVRGGGGGVELWDTSPPLSNILEGRPPQESRFCKRKLSEILTKSIRFSNIFKIYLLTCKEKAELGILAFDAPDSICPCQNFMAKTLFDV